MKTIYKYECLNKGCKKKWESEKKCKKCIQCICMVLDEKIIKVEEDIELDIMAPEVALDEMFDKMDD